MKARYKGDTLQIYTTIDTDITNWKIRAEVYDGSGGSVKLATSNSGGSDTEIYKQSISATKSIFIIYVPSASTASLEDDAFVEIEIDTGDTIGGLPEIVTIFKGSLKLLKQQITWTTS